MVAYLAKDVAVGAMDGAELVSQGEEAKPDLDEIVCKFVNFPLMLDLGS